MGQGPDPEEGEQEKRPNKAEGVRRHSNIDLTSHVSGRAGCSKGRAEKHPRVLGPVLVRVSNLKERSVALHIPDPNSINTWSSLEMSTCCLPIPFELCLDFDIIEWVFAIQS